LLKVGEPQFVIFAWGQALKPKGPPYLVFPGGLNYNIYTNYEITGECLTRTVCHLVHTNGLKMVIDSYNVESGNPCKRCPPETRMPLFSADLAIDSTGLKVISFVG
jgi:hypothetical protein